MMMKGQYSWPTGARYTGAIIAIVVMITAFPSQLVAATSQKTVVVVALDDSADVSARVELFKAACSRSADVELLSSSAISQRLRGVKADCAPAETKESNLPDASCYRPSDSAKLEAMLKEAHIQEGYFKTTNADELRRQVLEAYQSAPVPTARLRQLAGDSLLGRASGQYADSKKTGAFEWAYEAMRRFPNTKIDPLRYSPPLQRIFKKARRKVKRDSTYELVVRTNKDGRLWVDGNDFGTVHEERNVHLAIGKYRVWIQTDDGAFSLPYDVDLKDRASVVLNIDVDLDRRLSFAQTFRVTCAKGECANVLSRLQSRLAVDELVGIGQNDQGAVEALVVSSDQEPKRVPIESLEQTSGVDMEAALAPSASLSDDKPRSGSFFYRNRWVIAGATVGALALGTGAFLGLRARDKFDMASRVGISQAENDELNASGKKHATAANVLFGVSAAGFGLAGFAWWAEW